MQQSKWRTRVLLHGQYEYCRYILYGCMYVPQGNSCAISASKMWLEVAFTCLVYYGLFFVLFLTILSCVFVLNTLENNCQTHIYWTVARSLYLNMRRIYVCVCVFAYADTYGLSIQMKAIIQYALNSYAYTSTKFVLWL